MSSKYLKSFLAIIILLSYGLKADASFVPNSSSNLSLMNGLVGWWTFDGKNMINNVSDSSGVSPANNGFMQNFTSTSSAVVPGKVGQALSFNGTSNYINVGTRSSLDLSGPMTIIAWINVPRVTANAMRIAENGLNGTPVLREWSFDVNRTAARLTWIQGNADGTMIVTNNTNLSANKWYHVAAVRTGSTGSWKVTFYVNGVSDGAPTDANNPGTNSTVYIGNSPVTNAYFSGLLDDLRIYNRALSATEIRQLYDLGAAGKIATSPKYALSGANSGLVGWWTFDGNKMLQNVADSSGVSPANNGFMQNFTSTSSAVVPGTVGQSLFFNGTSNVVNLTSNPIGTGNNTISAWIKIPSYSALSVIASNGNTKFWFYIDTTPNALRCSNTGSATSASSATGAVPLNTWTHVVAVRNADNTCTLYINGAVSGTANQNAGVISAGDSGYIGGYSTTRHFNGMLDDLRIYNRVLSATEIRQLYDLGAAGKIATSPKYALSGANSGLVGWWTFDGNKMLQNVADSSGLGNNGFMQGFTSTSSAVVPGKVGQALNFNGTRNIHVNNNSNLSGMATLTVSGWIKINSAGPATPLIFTKRNSVSPSNSYYASVEKTYKRLSGVVINESGISSTYFSSGVGSLIFDQWQHFAMIYNGTKVFFYIDGKKTGSEGDLTGNVKITDYPLYLGSGPDVTYYMGAIDDFRIYNRALSATEIKQLYNLGK